MGKYKYSIDEGQTICNDIESGYSLVLYPPEIGNPNDHCQEALSWAPEEITGMARAKKK